MLNVSLNDLISQISIALDAVEADLMKIQPFHSKRVAVFCLAMGRKLGYSPERLFTLAGCALLHDNALTEYILSETHGNKQMKNLKTHCIIGEKNACSFPFPVEMTGFILYHHEKYDGSGPFLKRYEDIPQEASLIALADQIDVRFSLSKYAQMGSDAKPDFIEIIKNYIHEHTGSSFAPDIAGIAAEVLTSQLLDSLSDQRTHTCLRAMLPEIPHIFTTDELIRISAISAGIIDYKSTFTQTHSTQIANKAWYMAELYGYSKEEQAMLYVAAAFHDLGKLFIPTSVLEKPDKLTLEEFEIIKSHVRGTWDLLLPIKGFEQITPWAANHHEKLDGSGYPYGYTAADLDFNSRLLACLDIYQAVREARPYHDARSHADTMAILYSMAGSGYIEPTICSDLDHHLAALEGGLAPSPIPARSAVQKFQ